VYKQLENASLAVLPATAHPLEKADVSLLAFSFADLLFNANNKTAGVKLLKT